MAYKCDICGNMMHSKSNGTFFDQNRVLTSPSYWKYIATDWVDQNFGDYGQQQRENVLAMLIFQFSHDKSGFTVCGKCRESLEKDIQIAKEYGLEKYVTSDPSGKVDQAAAGVVAGTIWRRIHGNWPSSIVIGGGGAQGTLEITKGDKQQEGKKRKKRFGIF